MTRRTTALTATMLLLGGSAAALAAGSAQPLQGKWSATAKTRPGWGSGPMPVSFKLTGRKVSALTFGPATVSCKGGGGFTTLTMPRLTGFPVVSLLPRLSNTPPQLNSSFVRGATGPFTVTHDPIIPMGPVHVSIDGYFQGKKFSSPGADTIEIYYGADANGTLDVNGPEECIGAWSGVVARHK